MGIFMNTFFSEFKATLYSAIVYMKGRKTGFHYFGLNPKEITEEQAKEPAILCLHGIRHNQSGWLSLAKKLYKTHKGPIYTLNLHYDLKTEKDQIQARIEEIKEQYAIYGQEVKLRIIGHSLGGIIAVAAYNFIKGVKIERIITIASRLRWIPSYTMSHPERLKEIIDSFKEKIQEMPLYTIIAEKDWLVPIKSSLVINDPSKFHIVKKASHLSVLYSKEAEKKIIQWLTHLEPSNHHSRSNS